MTAQNIITILAFILGGGGIVGWYMSIRQARQTIEKDKRQKVIDEEMTAARGAGLLITTSSEAINVFNVALKAAQEDLARRDAIIDKLEAQVSRLEARVRELEGKTP